MRSSGGYLQGSVTRRSHKWGGITLFQKPYPSPAPHPGMSIMNTKTVILLLLLLLAVPAMAVVPPGRITVYSAPTGALACIDNKTCDTTGATFSVDGNAWHTVRVTEKGYREWTGNMYVTSDQTSMLTAYLDLDYNATAIQVNVVSGSGTVCLDNNDCRANVGSTTGIRSTLFTGVSPGYHTITVEASADYKDTSELVEVTLGKITSVNFELSPYIIPATTTPPATKATGAIRVYVDRTGSTICIDDGNCYINVGGTPGPGTGTVIFSEVTADKAHIITVAVDGYKPVSTPVLVGQDQIATVDVSLQRLGAETTVPALTPAQVPTVPPTMPTARSGLDALPVIGALALCGAVFLVRKTKE
jgi:hypothetical protein